MSLHKTKGPDPRFWRGKEVLLTGHTGFKGAWLGHWLRRLGARVTGVALPPSSDPSLYAAAALDEEIESHFRDIRDPEALTSLIADAAPDIVFHLAAQALVRESYRAPRSTFATNVMGTVHLLDAVRKGEGVRVVVAITTDKVYQNHEWPYPYRENDSLGGHDPYSASKAAAEMVIGAYRESFLRETGVAVASARAGNVIGGGDWSADRLIPDAVRAWQAGEPLVVRRPDAIRPWQHVLEPLAGYIRLAEALWTRPELAGAYNFGPATGDAARVRDVVEAARAAFGEGEVRWSEGDPGPHESGWLALEIAKARAELGVEPRWSLGVSIQRTMGWYREFYEGRPAAALCEADVEAYEADS